MKNVRKLSFWLAALSVASSLSGCSGVLDRVENIGKPPQMAKIENPTVQPNYQPVTWPLPESPPPPRQQANSLWQPGARAFFRDQRANRVGDILRVNIKIKDKAELDNSTDRTRQTTDTVAVPALLGLQRKLKLLPGQPDPAALIDLSGDQQGKGSGTLRRQETIETQVAAFIKQKLPNGNLVIDGKQEIRVNFELREISVTGVVRPEDINADNTIDSTQIAEARIVYGGRGQITDVQQSRYGAQFIEAVSPF